MIEREDELQGQRLHIDDRFTFRCHAGLACFNSCCHHKRLPLLPYDVLRLRRAVDLRSEQLLERHVGMELEGSSGWPALRLQLRDDGRCPFVEPDGCRVYDHRPTCCRIYPLGRAVAPGPDGPEEVFFAPDTPRCLGHDEPRTLTVREWIDDQGLAPYREANNRSLELFMHPRRSRPMELTERQLHGLIMALYNIDVFRQAVQTPGFAERFEIAPGEVERALAADEALLELGQSWLTRQLFGDS